MSSRQVLHTCARSVSRVVAVGISSFGIGSYHQSVMEESHCQDIFRVRSENSIMGSWEIFNWRQLHKSWSTSTEPWKTSLEANLPEEDSSLPLINKTSPSSIKSKDYDFVIIGNGNAGQSALRALRKRCPKATIAVIDPLRPTTTTIRIQHYQETVTGFDPNKRTVRLLSTPDVQLRYNHGILVATGARGAPPPLELFETSCLSRVLELRTTELLGNTKRPMMAPDRVRSAIMKIASNGGKVAILGSGWEALDLVCMVEKFGKKKPTIVFGAPGPAWNILPQYLSSELRKKLVKREIDILDRSVVRYIADVQSTKSRKMELHTARIYDLLDTRRTILDLLVIAPDSFGTKGTAALPTTEIPERMRESSDGRPWYKTWSQLTKSSTYEPSIVACFEDDGRISVNAELAVTSNIYAAGSVAKYPNTATGQATIAGEGRLNGSEAGRVAAFNMSREYIARQSGAFSNRYEEAESFARYSLPVWRSDIPSYKQDGDPIVSSLSSLGIQALCVGNCDSERLQTRGFWWTNTSAQRKINKLIEDDEADMGMTPERHSNISEHRSLRRRQSRKRKRMGLVQPIYGIGVVFYLDSNGCIRGTMTWGLPFADEEGGVINPRLLKAMEDAVLGNAGVSALDAEENHQIMNNAMAIQSQRFVEIAIDQDLPDSTATYHGLHGAIEGFSTPLYRYTEVAPSNQTNVKVLKRKEGTAMGVMGEDLYARDEMAMEQVQTFDETAKIPSNIPVTNYPVTVVPFQVEEVYGRKAASMDSLEEMNRFLATQRGWEENENRARPAKEDVIWLRPGDEKRNYSRKQMLIDAYRSIMFAHRS